MKSPSPTELRARKTGSVSIINHCAEVRDTHAQTYNRSMPEATGNNFTFETGLQQLEAIVKEMESGDLPLDRALDLFERGTNE